MPAASPAIRGREIALIALSSVFTALLMHWPLPLHLASDVARDTGDPLVQAWQVAWGGHALLHQPLDYFQANTFWPLANSLAFSEALAGYAPAGTVGNGFEAAVVRYNVLFFFAYALAFAGAWLLARELGCGRWGAAVAGAAFAYAPWRLEQDGHLHVLSSGGIPLSLFLLVRGYRRRSGATVVAGWLVACWQLALGFSLGLQFGYLVAGLGLGLGIWFLRRRPAVPRALVVATAAGVAAFALVGVLFAQPYLAVLDAHPEAERTPTQVAGLSPPLRAFVAAPEENLIWGAATEGIRDGLPSVPEQTLFPGLAIAALAVVGLAGPPYGRRLRLALGAGVLACALLSLGFKEGSGSFLYPYRLLFDYAPGWEGIRVPGRLTTLTSLGLALLAAAGAHRLLRAAAIPRRRLTAGAQRRVMHAVGLVVVTAVLLEGSGFDLGGRGFISGPSHPAVPRPPAGLAGLPSPRLHLPAHTAANRRYVLWSTDGFPKIVNGRGSFDPLLFERLVYEMRRFPDRRTVARLRKTGVRAVVFHPALASPAEAARVASRSVAAIGVRRVSRAGLIVYELNSR
jgi:hypothetical protein